MRANPRYLILPLTGLLLTGCVAKAAFDLATAPVKVAGKAVDVATTSQSEADENRGRKLRKREERYGALERDYSKQIDRCGNGNISACDKADEIRAEMDDLRPFIPAAR